MAPDRVELDDLLSALRNIRTSTSRPGELGHRVEAFLAAPPEDQAKRWFSIQVLLEDGQGGLYPAATRAAPLLLRLASIRSTPLRERIFPFLVYLALGDQEVWLARGCDRGGERSRSWFEENRRGHAIDQELRKGHDVLLAGLAGLGDEDPRVREAAAYALAWFGEDAARIRPEVATALGPETDPRARASLLLCLGLGGRYLDSDEDAFQIAEHLADAEQKVRIAAAYALMYLPGDHDPDRVFEEVRSAHRVEPWPEFPWRIFREPWFDFSRACLMAWVDRRREAVTETLLEIMEAVEVEHSPFRGPKPRRPCHWAARELRALLFPEGFAALVAGGLTTAQERFVHGVLKAPDAFDPLDLALPDLDDLRALAGLPRVRPVPVLTRPLHIGGETRTIGEWWASHGTSGHPPATLLCQAMLDALSCGEAIDALIEGARHDDRLEQEIAPRAGEPGCPDNWPPGFPLVPGGRLAPDTHPGTTPGSVVQTYDVETDVLLDHYRVACAEAGWSALREDGLQTGRSGHLNTSRGAQRVRLYWVRGNGPSTELTVSRAWHLGSLWIDAVTARHGRAFYDALVDRAGALVAQGIPSRDNPIPGFGQVLGAATRVARSLDIDPDPVFDTLAAHLHRAWRPERLKPTVTAWLALLPEPRREALVLSLLDRDAQVENVAGYAGRCPTPLVLDRVMARARSRGGAHDLALVGAPIVPRLLEAVGDRANPRRVVFANALARIGAPATPALLALLDDEDKNIREIATRGLAKADLEVLEPRVRALLADRRKANRELGARLLQPLPASTARAALAADFLATEKTASVRALLEPIARETP